MVSFVGGNWDNREVPKVVAERRETWPTRPKVIGGIPVAHGAAEVRRSFGFVRTALLVLITQSSAEVRLGGLFQHTPIKVGRFMAFVMAIQEINNSTDLLPGNALR